MPSSLPALPIIGPMLIAVFSLLDSTLGVLFHLSPNERFSVIIGVLAVAALVSAGIVFITARVVDAKQMKSYKQRMSELQEKIKTAQNSGDSKATGKAQREMLEINSKIMSLSFKPMIYTFVPIVLIFTWLRNYEYLNGVVGSQGYLVKLPFDILVFGRTQLGWLGWYIFCSFPISTLIKKIFNLDSP